MTALGGNEKAVHNVRKFEYLSRTSLPDTCVEPLSLSGLSQLGPPSSTDESPSAFNPLTYGTRWNFSGLRNNTLSLYSDNVDDLAEKLFVLPTQGAISANSLVLDTLLGPGDHVICQYPAYQQLYEVPRRAGAEVSLWRSRPENDWIPVVAELASLVRENTKMIIINNPNNPTGASLPRRLLGYIVSFAAQHNIIVLCDEVFRPLFHSPSVENPPSILAFAEQYQNIIAISSMSKAFSLPGIRLGWLIAPTQLEGFPMIDQAADYTTITVSQVDQEIAAHALSPTIRDKILQRSMAICKHNLAAPESFVASHRDRMHWVRPTGGSAAFIQVVDPDSGAPVDDAAFCERLVQETGLLIVSGGKTFGTEHPDEFRGFLRVGFVCSSAKFESALRIWGDYLDRM